MDKTSIHPVPRWMTVAQFILSTSMLIALFVLGVTILRSHAQDTLLVGSFIALVVILTILMIMGIGGLIMFLKRNIELRNALNKETLRAIERQSNQQEEVFREIAEKANFTFWVRDTVNNKFVYVSPEYDNLFGSNREELYQNPEAYQTKIHPDDLPAQKEALRKSREEKTPYNAEYRIVRPDGSYRWIWARAARIYNTAGESIRSIGIAQDITHIKDEQAQAIELASERERRRILSTFIRNISHEFRTPLATIHSGLYLLSKTKSSDDKLERIGRIEEQANHIMTLVDDMVALTQLDSQFEMVMDDVEMSPLLAAIARSFAVDAAVKNIEYKVDIAEQLPILHVAPEQIRWAVRNVISNALRYTENSGSISVSAGLYDQHLRMVIKDSGVGITEADQQRIFETFYRVDSSRTTPGFGLGLPVAERIIALHGGSIKVESTLGEGSIFTLMLPVQTLTPVERV